MPKGLRISSLIAALAICLPLAAFAAPDIQARYEKALKDAQSLTNFEIEFLDYMWMPHNLGAPGIGTNKPPFNRTYVYTFTASGEKYRAESKLVSGSETNLIKQAGSAFDGDLYRTYMGDQSRLTRGTKKPSGGGGDSSFNPLVAPFMFLAPLSDDCPYCVLHLADLASSAATKKLIPQPKHVAGGSLQISLSHPTDLNQPSNWKISIDENGDSFIPKTITVDQGTNDLQTILQLLNYTNLGAYQFPTRIDWLMTLSNIPPSPPTLIGTGTVTLVSVRIPASIPDSTFTMTDVEKSATRIWDWDQKKFVDASGNVLKPKPSPPRPKLYDESADGSKQIADALAIASKEHKHVLLEFGANWCGSCYTLHDLFETNSQIAGFLQDDYVVALIDVNKDHNKDTDTKYGHPAQFGLPVLVVLDSAGKQLTTQDAGKLEGVDRYSPEKVMAFLKEWAPKK